MTSESCAASTRAETGWESSKDNLAGAIAAAEHRLGGHIAILQIDAQLATENQVQVAIGGARFEQVIAAFQFPPLAAFKKVFHAFKADVGKQLGVFQMLAD